MTSINQKLESTQIHPLALVRNEQLGKHGRRAVLKAAASGFAYLLLGCSTGEADEIYPTASPSKQATPITSSPESTSKRCKELKKKGCIDVPQIEMARALADAFHRASFKEWAELPQTERAEYLFALHVLAHIDAEDDLASDDPEYLRSPAFFPACITPASSALDILTAFTLQIKAIGFLGRSKAWKIDNRFESIELDDQYLEKALLAIFNGSSQNPTGVAENRIKAVVERLGEFLIRGYTQSAIIADYPPERVGRSYYEKQIVFTERTTGKPCHATFGLYGVENEILTCSDPETYTIVMAKSH